MTGNLKVAAVAACAAATLGLSGCASSGSTTPPASSAGSSQSVTTVDGVACPEPGTKLAYSPLDSTIAWFGFVSDGFKEQVAKCPGVEAVIIDGQGDGAKQAMAVESALSSGVKGVGIAAVDGKAITPVVDEAKTKGVFVVQNVSEVPGNDANVGVTESEFGGLIGQIGGEWLLKAKPGQAEYKVAILNADSLGAGLLERKKGLTDGLAAALGGAKFTIVADNEAYAEDKALNVASTVLQATPDVDIFLCVNDVGALGALAAIQAKGLEAGKDITAIGSLNSRSLEAIKAGYMPGGIVLPGADQGKSVALALFRLLAGEPKGFSENPTPVSVTTPEQADEWLTKGGI